tara:strand:+ start:336 stop:443 length:108 start_codon:yes stop_codon:yes gene_type:complete
MNNLIAAIDVGTNSIITIIAKKNKTEFKLLRKTTK